MSWFEIKKQRSALLLLLLFVPALLFSERAAATGEVITGGADVTEEVKIPRVISDIVITGTGNDTLPVKLRTTSGTLAMSTTTGLTFTGSPTGSTLYFSGTRSDINTALATLTYTRNTIGTDTLEVSLVEPSEVFFPDNGHLYEYVSSTLTWGNARTAAQGRVKYGATGYLTTITSQTENDFVAARLSNAGWMGGSDSGSEGVWRWVTGPENNTQFWQGNFSGSAFGGNYANWNTNEPNDSGSNEDCAQFLSGSNGKWNDLPCTVTTLPGYVVEYGASGSLPTVQAKNIAITTSDTIAPTVPGTPSTTSPTTTQKPTWTWSASTDSGVGLASPAYTLQWSQDATFVTSVTSDTTNSASFMQPTTLTDGTWYFRVRAIDNATNTSSWASGSVTIDNVAPVISNIAIHNVSDTTETITWATDTPASSRIAYGPTASYDSLSGELNTSPRVTTHSITLTDLVACSVYHLQLRSIDSIGNQGTSSDTTFISNGCAGSSGVTSHTEETISHTSGGSVSLTTSTDSITLDIPANFSSSDADFQIKELDSSAALAATGMPGTLQVAGKVYDIKAMEDAETAITSFSQPVTITLSYDPADVTNLIESSLIMYRWNSGVGWQQLDDCVVNTASNIVTCTTTGFSTFGLFGQAKSVITSNLLPTYGSSSSSMPYYISVRTNEPDIAEINTAAQQDDTGNLETSGVQHTNDKPVATTDNNLPFIVGSIIGAGSLFIFFLVFRRRRKHGQEKLE